MAPAKALKVLVDQAKYRGKFIGANVVVNAEVVPLARERIPQKTREMKRLQ